MMAISLNPQPECSVPITLRDSKGQSANNFNQVSLQKSFVDVPVLHSVTETFHPWRQGNPMRVKNFHSTLSYISTQDFTTNGTCHPGTTTPLIHGRYYLLPPNPTPASCSCLTFLPSPSLHSRKPITIEIYR